MGQSLIAIHFGNHSRLFRLHIWILTKKDKNRDASNGHRFLSLPTRGKQTSQIKMGVLCRRLILIKAFEMKNLLWTRLIWLASTLEDTRCISTWWRACVCLPLGFILVTCYTTYSSICWWLWHSMHWDTSRLLQLLVRENAFTSKNWSVPWGG